MSAASPIRNEFVGMAGPDWRCYRNRLHALALALTGNPDAADDLTQQTLAAVLSSRPDCLPHFGYLRKAMATRWLDTQRGVRRSVIRMARLAVMHLREYDDRGTKDDTTEADEHEKVRAAIATLPPLQRATLTLRLMEELPYDDIADILGTSPAAVRSNLHAARRRVRGLMKDQL